MHDSETENEEVITENEKHNNNTQHTINCKTIICNNKQNLKR